MKLGYVLPGTVASLPGGKEKMAKRLDALRQMVSETVDVSIHDINNAPPSIESLYEEYLSIPGTAEKMLELEQLGYHAAILGCFGDPGLDGIREIVKNMAIIGPGQAALAMASMCGNRFSIITATDSLVGVLEQMAYKLVLPQKLASVRAVNIPVLDLQKDMDTTLNKLITEAKIAIEKDRADTLVLGCMSLGFLDVSTVLAKEINAPVINPVNAAVRIAEAFAAQEICHSPIAYPLPPKMKN